MHASERIRMFLKSGTPFGPSGVGFIVLIPDLLAYKCASQMPTANIIRTVVKGGRLTGEKNNTHIMVDRDDLSGDELRELQRLLEKWERVDEGKDTFAESELDGLLRLWRKAEKYQRQKKQQEVIDKNPEAIICDDIGEEFAIEMVLQRLGALTGISPSVNEAADIEHVQGTSSWPFKAVTAIENQLKEATAATVQGMWANAGSRYYDGCEQLLDQGADTTFLFDSDAIEAIQNTVEELDSEEPASTDALHEEWLTTLRETQRCEVYVSSKEITIPLFILDETVIVGLIPYFVDDMDGPAFTFEALISDDPGLREWADKVFEHYQADSTHLDKQQLNVMK